MSDDQLDNDLKNRIKQVFDNYEDNTAKEGWLLLREKYPEKEKKRVVFWLWRVAAVAAILLILLSIDLWLNMPIDRQNIVSHNKKSEHADTINLKATAIVKNKKQVTDSGASTAYQQQANVVSQSHNITKTAPYMPSIGFLPSKIVKAGNTVFVNPVDSNAKNTVAYKSASKDKEFNAIDSPATTGLANIANYKTPLKLIPTGPATKPAEKEQPKVLADNQVSKGMQSLFDKESKASQTPEEKNVIDKRVAFGIYAATYVNYAKGSDKQFNTGFGVTSDIKLTDNLSILTGVSIAQNSLNYSNANATSPIPLYAAASHNFANTASALTTVVPASKDLNASLVNLDIPVDLKYTFNPQKGNTYVAAGFSSGTFVNETYNTSYSYNTANNSSVQQPGDITHKAFDNFYFAQMLNVSFGVGYPLGKNQIVIEPFFKYPLNGLGDQHILFGSGGINLKFNFDPPKSKH